MTRWKSRKINRIRHRSPHSEKDERTYDAVLTYYDMESEHAQDVLDRARNAKKGEHYPWSPVPYGPVQRVWRDFARNGIVTDEEALDKVAEQIVRKLAQIDANTILMGHDTAAAMDDLYERSHVEYDEEIDEKLGWYLLDPVQGQWIISDAAFESSDPDNLGNLAVRVLAETDPTQKIMLLDRILNFVHRRGSFASWVVEGGTGFLDQLSSKEN